MSDPKPANPLLKRVEVATDLVKAWKGRPLDWGKADCAILMAQAVKAFGHDARLDRGGLYRSEATAIRAVRRCGFDDLAGFMDDLLGPPIAPAATLPCDILGFARKGEPMLALAVALGNRKVLGFRAETGLCEISATDFSLPDIAVRAWRV